MSKPGCQDRLSTTTLVAKTDDANPATGNKISLYEFSCSVKPPGDLHDIALAVPPAGSSMGLHSQPFGQLEDRIACEQADRPCS